MALVLAKKKDYTFDITFNQVTGLKIGAGVSYAGIDAGRVSAIEAIKIRQELLLS